MSAFRWGWLSATALLLTAGTAHATNPTLQGQSPSDQVQIQFVYSKAFFVDQLVLNNGGATGLNSCTYTHYSGSAINNCIFDEGICGPDVNTSGTPCAQPFAPGDYTCDCYSNSAFVNVGTVSALGGNASNQVQLDFQLYVATQRAKDGSGFVPANIRYDGDPNAASNVWDPSDTNHAFDHLHISPLDTSGSTLLLEWEDGVSGGDADYNDLVAVVRVVPSDCVAAGASPFCGKAAYTGTDTRFFTHVTAADASLANTGLQMHTNFINFGGATTNTAVCQIMHLELPATSTQLENFYSYHYTTNPTPACSTASGQQAPFLALASDGVETLLSDGTQGACNALPARGPTDDVLSLAAGSSTAPSATNFDFPSGAGQYLYDNFDSRMSQDGDKLRNGTAGPRSTSDIRKSLYNKDSMYAPLTAYVFQGVPAGFHCPSGANVNYGGQLGTDTYKPLTPFLQTVPDVVALHSPISITIPTVPLGYEDPTGPSVSAFIVYSWQDNLSQLDPSAPSLSGFISTKKADGVTPLNSFDNAQEPFDVGGSANRAVRTTLALPNNLPEGFEGTLVAVLVEKATGKNLIISTYPVAKDDTAPTVSAASTVRTQNGVTASATAADRVSGVGNVSVMPIVNNASLPATVLAHVSGDFYDATSFSGTVGSLQPSDVVALDLSADDTHFNATPAVRLPVANNGGDRIVECQSFSGANVTLDGSRSTGPSDVSVNYTWTGPFGAASGVTVVEPLAFGASTVTLTLADGRGYTGTQTSTITVGDTVPPSLTAAASPSCVWPPNHKLVPFALNAGINYTVSDTCDAHPTVRIVNVTRTDGTPVGFNSSAFCARTDKEETYTITLEAKDAHGNTSQATTTVRVPHDSEPGCATASTVDDNDPRCQF